MGYNVLQCVTTGYQFMPPFNFRLFFKVFDKITVTPEEVYILSTMQ